MQSHSDELEQREGHASKSVAAYDLGAFEPAVKARLARWTAEKAAERIWLRDFTFWVTEHVPELTDRLGWLDLPESMQREIQDAQTFAAEVRSEGFTSAVLLGMGGSSLAPEIYQAVFGNQPGFPPLFVLNSTHPDAVAALENRIDLAHTLFIVASKSGTTVETLSFFKYFYKRVSAAPGEPGSRFAAITDPGSPLERLAVERGFRHVFQTPPDVGGRYSALSYFGLAPAALIGMDVAKYLERARRMSWRCRIGDADANPGLMLGAILGELATAGRDKVTFFTSPSLAAFPRWLEQLVAESTGKQGKGIVPIVGEPPGDAEHYGKDRIFVSIVLAGEKDPGMDSLLDALVSKGHPALRFVLNDRTDLAEEMFRWEVAVAAAGAVLGINPFDQPDVQKAKTFAKQAMAREADSAGRQTDTLAVTAGDDLLERLKQLLESIKPGDYLAVQAFIAPTNASERILSAIRTSIRDRYAIATAAGYGPSFLHSTGQLHKGGPDSGLFLQIVDVPARDEAVPETDYTFARLIGAQARGDYMALHPARRILRVDLGADAPAGLAVLAKAIDTLN
jgi:transaldolase/glucose-6-phosphate isomerase